MCRLLWDPWQQAGSSTALFLCPCAKKQENRICVQMKAIYKISLTRACLKHNLAETHFGHLQTNLFPASFFTFDI